LADLHLGWTARWLDRKSAEYASKRDQLLEQLTAWIIGHKQDLDLVLIVGDLFETHRPQESLVQKTIAELTAWERAGLTVITVPGNHDEITYHDSVFQRHREEWPGILVTNPMPEAPLELTIKGQPVYFYSLAYTGGLTKINGYLQPYPRVAGEGIHLAAFHGSLDWETDERGLPLSSKLLAGAGYDYVALGHFHRPQQLQLGGTTMAYAGAIRSKGFSDIGCGQLTLVTLQSGAARVELLPWEEVDHRVVELDVGRWDSQEAVIAAIEELADPNLLLRVELTGAAGFLLEPKTIASRLERHFYHLEVVDTSLHLADGLLESWAKEKTVRGHFVRRLQEQLQTANDASEREVIELALRRGMAAFLQGGE